MDNLINITNKHKHKHVFLKNMLNKTKKYIRTLLLTGFKALKHSVKLTKDNNESKHKVVTKTKQNTKCQYIKSDIKKPSTTVISIVEGINKFCEINENNPDITDSNKKSTIHLQDEKYRSYTKFIIEHSEIDKLPKIRMVEQALNITKTTREKYQNWAIEDKLIIKTGPNSKKLNLEKLEEWENEN